MIYANIMPENRPSEIFEHGIRRAWLDSNRIALIITSDAMSREAIDTWAELVLDTVRQWPADQPIMLIQELAHPAQGLVPYGRKRAEEVSEALRQHPHGYSALVVNGRIANNMVKLALRLGRGTSSSLTERAFCNQEDAYAWLRKMQAYQAVN